MPRVRAIHLSPVKSLRLQRTDRAELTPTGIPGDRAFVVLDAQDRVATLRKHPWMALVGSRYDPASKRLELDLPDGTTVGGVADEREPHEVKLFGRPLDGALVDGPWSEALTAVAGAPMRLMLTQGGAAQDAHPVSMLSAESVAELAGRSGIGPSLDPRRFRNTLLLEDGEAHVEDEWVGRRVRAGQAVLRVVMRDARCSMTTRNPDTGRRDLDTLRLIAAYRPPANGDICFGVYAEVEQPGIVAVRDTVEPLAKGAS
jgi:uncharacterized protein